MPTQSDDLESADSVAITFKMQNNDLKHDTGIHGRTDDRVSFVPGSSMGSSCE
jgi:hypothetical protein